jgi:hypothetical protein
MFGKSKKGIHYYACQPSLNHCGRVAERFPHHPYTVWVREDRLLDGIGAFFSERVFGPGRGAFLATELGQHGARAEAEHVAKLRALRRSVNDIEGRKARLIRTLETKSG